MRSMRFLFFSLLLTTSAISFAQNSGLYGKKRFLEVNGLGYMPIIGWFAADLNEVYKKEGNLLLQGKDIINYGFRLNLGTTVKRNVALSIEFGYDYANINSQEYINVPGTDDWGYSYTAQYYIQHEMLDVNSMVIMPKIEITKDGGLLPLGLNHQIGIGYTSSIVKDRDYLYKTSGFNYENFTPSEDPETLIENLVNFDQKFKGYSFLYAFNVRTPVTKSLLINYGLRYTLNLTQMSPTYSPGNFGIESTDVASLIRRMRLTNVITFNLGLTFAF